MPDQFTIGEPPAPPSQFTVGEPPAPPTPPQQSEGFGGWLEGLGKVMRPVQMPGLGGTVQADLTPQTIGAGKSVGGGLSTVLDFMHWLGMKYIGAGGTMSGYSPTEDAFRSDYLKQHPGAPEDEIGKAYQQTAQQKVNDHMQDASAWLRRGTEPIGAGENVGYFGEQAGEMGLMPELAAEDLFRLAGKPGMKVADQLANTKDLAKALTDNPAVRKYLAIGIKATKTAAEEGGKLYGQTYLHTEDPDEAARAGRLGLGMGAAAGGLEVGAQAWRDKFGTKNIKIGPVEIPALARQVNEKGFAEPGRAEEAPKIQAAQEAGFNEVIGHTARDATRSALSALNESRPLVPTITDEARLLGAPGAVPRPQFTIEGTPITEVAQGPLTQRAEEIPERTATASYGAPPSPGFGPSFTPRSAWQGNKPVPGHLHPGEEASAAARRDVVGGGGTMSTSSLPEAEGWLHRYEEAQMRPEYDDMPPERQAEIERQRKSLQDQLDMFYGENQPAGHPAYTQRFQPVDVDDAAKQVHTFGDASAQIEAAAKPVYQRLDQLSNGDFTKLRQQSQGAKRLMRRATTTESFEKAQQNYYEANNEITALIDRSSPHITQEDYQATRNAWRQARRLDELDTVFERMMNGVTHEEGAMGMPRYLEKARTKAIQNYLDTGTNQQQIGDLIGREGIINLKNVTNLLSDRATSQTAQKMMWETTKLIAQRVQYAGYGAAAGHVAARLVGMNPAEGAFAGGVTADALRWGWRYAATTPRVGQMIDMAVRNGVTTKIAAPLIARAIAQAAGLFKPAEQEPAETKP
jgi:hypothetical protein